jgi:hypothetical protein
MRREAGKQRESPCVLETFARLSLLELFTSGIGSAWGVLAAVKFFAGPFLPQIQEMNLLSIYYLAVGLAIIHLIDSLIPRRTDPRS